MKRLLTFDYERKEAKKITLEMKGNVQEYALNFLNIFNHVREYPSTFYKIENNAGNRVYVTVNPKDEDSVVDYLESFGKIIKTTTVRLYEVIANYEYEKFDMVYDRDDVELLIDIE
jgi:hypothetical protein